MKKLVVTVAIILIASSAFPQHQTEGHACTCKADKLNILWTTAEKDVFTKVAFPYGLNSKKQGWWKEVEVIVWGPSSKLLAEDEELQEAVGKMKDAGVILTACKWCADQYGVSDALSDLGIDVKYMGKPLTEYMKTGEKVLVF